MLKIEPLLLKRSKNYVNILIDGSNPLFILWPHRASDLELGITSDGDTLNRLKKQGKLLER
jgi:hypothetical protein